MDPAYLSALSALAGSFIGAVASLGTAWLTQAYQDRAQRLVQESTRREKLFGEFLEEATKRYGEAMVSDVTSPAALVGVYALMGKMRLFASHQTIGTADQLLTAIANAYRSPPMDLVQADLSHDRIHEFVREFTESCRADLGHAAILRGSRFGERCRRAISPIERSRWTARDGRLAETEGFEPSIPL
jgi:hypothetical protein